MSRGQFGNTKLPPRQAGRLDLVCDRFEEAWLGGGSPRLEDFLLEVTEADRPALVRELLALELEYRGRRGERPVPEEYLQRFPELADTLVLQVEVDHVRVKAGDAPFLTVAAPADQPHEIGRCRIDRNIVGASGTRDVGE